MSVEVAGSFYHDGAPFVVFFCHQCGSSPIVLPADTFDQLEGAKALDFVRCKGCGGKPLAETNKFTIEWTIDLT